MRSVSDRLRFGLRERLLALVLLALVPAAGLIVWMNVEARELRAAEVRTSAQQLARVSAAAQGRVVDEARELLLTLSSIPVVRDGMPGACSAFLGSLLPRHPGYANIGVIGLDGLLQCSAAPTTGTVDLSGRSDFKRALERSRFEIGEYEFGPVIRRKALFVAAPLDSDGIHRGALFAGLEGSWLNRLAAEAQLPPGATLTVLDRKGTIIARHPEPERFVGGSAASAPIGQRIMREQDGTGESVGVDGLWRLYAFTALKSHGEPYAFVAVGIPYSVAFAEADRVLRRSLLLFGVTLLAALGAAWAGSRGLVLRRTGALLAATHRLQAGDLSARSGVSGGDELGRLAATFDQMAEGLERREAERQAADQEIRRLNADLEQRVAERTAALQVANADLREHERFLDSVVENVPNMLFVKDAKELRFVRFNKAGEELLGYARQELIGRNDHDLFDRTEADFFIAKDRDVLRRGSVVDIPEEPIHTRHRGKRLLHTKKIPILDDGGAPRYLLGISEDITERKAAEGALVVARREAEQANRAKSQFLSRMSHDFRTPLNAILGFAQLMDSDHLTSDERESIAQIRNAGEHLLGLINEVLDITRIETGHLALSPEPVSVLDVVKRAVGLIAPLASRHQVALHVELAASRHRYVLADRQRLSQVLLNLLSNAVKYNRRGGDVTVVCREVGADRIQIRVRDTGPGIPADRLSRLFRPFDRLGVEESGVEGTGLGLTVARDLARAMGGSIDVESAVGQGSTFSVELPLTSPPAVAAPAPRSRGADPRRTRGDVSGRVLYVDDNRSNARLLERVLARRPEVNLTAASLGSEGLAAARSQRPDLILLDLHLPDMHGADVLRALKDDETTRDIPVAILSADATSGHEQRLIDAGAITYLTKPLEIARVLRLVDQVLGNGAPRDEDGGDD